MQKDHKTKQLKAIGGVLIRFLLLLGIGIVLYNAQWTTLHWEKIQWANLTPIFMAVLLIPINFNLEWSRYKLAMQESTSADQLRWSFYQGTVASFFTPQLLASTLGRMKMENAQFNTQVVNAAVYTGLAQFIVTLGFACLGSAFILLERFPSVFIVFLFVVTLGIWVYFKFDFIFGVVKKIFPKWKFEINMASPSKGKLVGLSLLRYLVFSVQFHLIFISFGGDFSLLSVLVLMLSYGLITLSPSILFGKIVIRETIAVAVFAFYGFPAEVILISSFLTWLLNVVIPVIFALIMMNLRWQSTFS